MMLSNLLEDEERIVARPSFLSNNLYRYSIKIGFINPLLINEEIDAQRSD